MKGQSGVGGKLILLVLTLAVVFVSIGIIYMPGRVIDTHTETTECKSSV